MQGIIKISDYLIYTGKHNRDVAEAVERVTNESATLRDEVAAVRDNVGRLEQAVGDLETEGDVVKSELAKFSETTGTTTRRETPRHSFITSETRHLQLSRAATVPT